MSLICVVKHEKLGSELLENPETEIETYSQKFIYAIGGKTPHGVCLKTIEKYDIELDEWIQIRTQLNYSRVFASSICFRNRFLYVFSGTVDTESIEVIDLEQENELMKA